MNTPATRVLVGDKAKLTADEIEKVKESIKAVNPGSTVVVDDKGNATVTTPEGKTATIPAAQLVKDAKDVAAKNNGENINVDFEKQTVADFNNLTDAEKEAAKAKIKGANADVVEVVFDKAGNATVITKDGKVYTIAAKDIFKQRPYVPSNGGGNNSGNGASGNNGATNTDAKVDKAKLEGAIRQLDELIIKESAKLDAETAKKRMHYQQMLRKYLPMQKQLKQKWMQWLNVSKALWRKLLHQLIMQLQLTTNCSNTSCRFSYYSSSI